MFTLTSLLVIKKVNVEKKERPSMKDQEIWVWHKLLHIQTQMMIQSTKAMNSLQKERTIRELSMTRWR